MKITLNILILFVLFQSSAQNLVPDPSFEDTTTCPGFQNDPLANMHWYQPSQGIPYHATSDVFHLCNSTGTLLCPSFPSSVPENCVGYQYPLHGQGYGGLIPYSTFGVDYKEYLGTKLTNQLVSGIEYYIEFYVSKGDKVNYSISEVGAFFSSDSLIQVGFESVTSNEGIINQNGLITNSVGWVKIFGYYTANGTENFLFIGSPVHSDSTTTQFGQVNPNSDYNHAYYFVDQVCVSSNPEEFCPGFVGIDELEPNSSKQLIKIIDSIGRETIDKPNELLFYVYSDGTTEKVFRVE